MLVVGIARVDHTTQNSPYDNISASNNLCSRVDIAQYDDIAAMMNGLAGTHCPPYKEGIIRFSRVALSLRFFIHHSRYDGNRGTASPLFLLKCCSLFQRHD